MPSVLATETKCMKDYEACLDPAVNKWKSVLALSCALHCINFSLPPGQRKTFKVSVTHSEDFHYNPATRQVHNRLSCVICERFLAVIRHGCESLAARAKCYFRFCCVSA